MKLYELEKQLNLMREWGANNLTEVKIEVSGHSCDIKCIKPVIPSNYDINKESVKCIDIMVRRFN